MWVCACHSARVEVRGQSVGVSSLLLPVDLRDQTQVIRLGSQYLYLLSHLVCFPFFFFETGFLCVVLGLTL